jgi:hypothetical protein
MSDPDLRFTYQLAEMLHRTVDEILEMSTDEFRGWIAYLNHKHDELSNNARR